MQEAIKRKVEKSSQPYFHTGLRYLSDFEVSETSRLSKTSKDNFKELSNTRMSLIITNPVDDLTAEEIADIHAFKSNTERPTRFTNVDSFLEDLNE